MEFERNIGACAQIIKYFNLSIKIDASNSWTIAKYHLERMNEAKRAMETRQIRSTCRALTTDYRQTSQNALLTTLETEQTPGKSVV